MAGHLKRVIVKFFDNVNPVPPYDSDAAIQHFFDADALGPWTNLKTQFQKIEIGRLFTSSPHAIVNFVAQVAHTGYDPPNLLTFFAITCPPAIDRKKVVEVLSDSHLWPKVERAYVAGGPGPSPGIILGPGESLRQGYLDPAPPPGGSTDKCGIDARYAWGIPGGDGGATGLRFVDLEQGWLIQADYGIDHEDFPAGISLRVGNGGREVGHGTAVLGIIAAKDNNSIAGSASSAPRKDIVGIAPKVPNKFVASGWEGNAYSIANAINQLLVNNILQPGDVLLVEAQTGDDSGIGTQLPVEVEYAEFVKIRMAAERNITVIEAAGNWGADLDRVTHDGLATGRYILRRNVSPNPPHADFQDSQAIMVGGCELPKSEDPPYHIKYFPPDGLNYGSRIDCFAWGEQVVTTGFAYRDGNGPLPVPSSPEARYFMFDGTSSASAILAGAALVLQGIKKTVHGGFYTPTQMRDILRDPATGTPHAVTTPPRLIGVMPDLRKILRMKLSLSPDVYVRDNVGDTGATPHTGPIASSPDIILRLAPPVANPQADYGEGSGTENDFSISTSAEAGKDHVVYVRVRNRGNVDTVNVAATVFWSPVATLVTPDLWTRVDQATDPLLPSVVVPQVPKGNILTVSPPIRWNAADIPGDGHYCFVCIVGNGADPAPNQNAISTWPGYMDFIRNHNNVAWRNFNVVSHGAAMSAGMDIELPFFITGPHDQGRQMQLEFASKAPQNTSIVLQVPSRYRDVIADLGSRERDTGHGVARVSLASGKQLRSRVQVFPTAMMVDCLLRIRIPKESRNQPARLSISQLFEGLEVGRITWLLQL